MSTNTQNETLVRFTTRQINEFIQVNQNDPRIKRLCNALNLHLQAAMQKRRDYIEIPDVDGIADFIRASSEHKQLIDKQNVIFSRFGIRQNSKKVVFI